MKDNRLPLRAQRQQRGWPLDYDVLCCIGAIALTLLFFGVDQLFMSKRPGTGVIEQQRSIPQRADLPASQALASVNHTRP
ncbi:hypothetical protein ACLUTX_15420 [Enterobacterales bacterium AE_CKDN230030158-1A_HGKHYDSX7]